jgi:hypothetical protein
MAPQSIILAPHLAVAPSRVNDPLEASVHTIPKPLLREFHHVFGETYLEDVMQVDDKDLELLAIPTNQQARRDLVAVGDEVEQEKDRLLNVVRTSRLYISVDQKVSSELIHSVSQ